MQLKEFEFVRKRQQCLMPDHMKKFALELSKKELPSQYNLTKTEYIQAWYIMFDDGDFEDELATKQLSRFNVLELKIAFEWTLKHFAELDLGGNLKWYLDPAIL